MRLKLSAWHAVAGTVLFAMACTQVQTPVLTSATIRTQARARVAPPVIAKEIASPNFDERPTPTISAIVLHHTAMASTAAETAVFFQNPKNKVSSQYIVDRSGAIVRCVPDAKRAWHAGTSSFQGVSNVNDFSIGIEICNLGDSVEPYPPAQMKAVVHLVAWLAATHKVPMANLTRHRDVALPAGRKKDTSDNFDHKYVATAAQKLINGQPVPAYVFKPAPSGYRPAEQTYKVMAGDTWESIADDHFDVAALAPALQAANPARRLEPGTLLRLPTRYPKGF